MCFRLKQRETAPSNFNKEGSSLKKKNFNTNGLEVMEEWLKGDREESKDAEITNIRSSLELDHFREGLILSVI